MQNAYQVLCLLEQHHSYFQNPQAASVSLVPTPDTARRMQRAGLWLKTTAAGTVVLRDGSGPAAALPIPEFVFPLRFRVEPLSPYFANFTELPELPADPVAYGARPVFYFRADKPKGGATLLKAQSTPRLPLTPLTLTVRTDQRPASRAGVQLVDVARRQTLHKALPVDEAGQVAVDVRPWGGGRYQLRVGRTVLLDFYADEQLYAAQAWGVLEIGAAALRQAPLTVRLTFAARRTYWKYLFRYHHAAAEKYRQAPQTLSVTATAQSGMQLPAVVFEAVAPPRGIDAAFVSKDAIALAERPGYTCTLRWGLPAPRVVLLLPGADAAVVRPAPPNPILAAAGPAYSEILVHL
ncbi:hypothetical protein [Hymenobacter elongatus]|uniref:Uncharacterized protein n=1 Tax=Hymenobacter elongatus TaxID=877208 RepID=A0A4Z0PG76_9BACT|nr:hypothetical protein [Hymenobacter elongatus]TGE14015.1 hypothetical protein E5J99_18010 [Hymenobacter elongatus]